MTIASHRKFEADAAGVRLLQVATRVSLVHAEELVSAWSHTPPEMRQTAHLAIQGHVTAATITSDGLDLEVAVRLLRLDDWIERTPVS